MSRRKRAVLPQGGSQRIIWRAGKLEFGPDDEAAESSKRRQRATEDPSFEGQVALCADRAIESRKRKIRERR